MERNKTLNFQQQNSVVHAEEMDLNQAILETGAQVMVPLFISVGEMIRVDTRNDSYLGREN